MGIIIFLVIVSLSIIAFFVYDDYKQKIIDKEIENENFVIRLIDKIYDDFSDNPSRYKISYINNNNYKRLYYIFNDESHINVVSNFDGNSFMYYHSNYYEKFKIDNEILYKLELKILAIYDYIDELEINMKREQYTNDISMKHHNKTKKNVNLNDIKKYNKLVKIFKLRKKQLLSMNQNNKDYESLKNEYFVLVDKLTELKKKI